MRRALLGALLIVSGVIHLLPLTGVLGADSLSKLYGLSFEDSGLLILMRHRSVLFGLLGALLVYSAFRRRLQGLAIAAGLVSVISFLILAGAADSYDQPIGRVVTADWVALVCLVLATGLRLSQGRQAPEPRPTALAGGEDARPNRR